MKKDKKVVKNKEFVPNIVRKINTINGEITEDSVIKLFFEGIMNSEIDMTGIRIICHNVSLLFDDLIEKLDDDKIYDEAGVLDIFSETKEDIISDMKRYNDWLKKKKEDE